MGQALFQDLALVQKKDPSSQSPYILVEGDKEETSKHINTVILGSNECEDENEIMSLRGTGRGESGKSFLG